jgi:hypothetical protein
MNFSKKNLLLWVIFALLDPGPDPDSEYGSTQKIVTKISKIWVWDPGSEIRDPEITIPDPGSRGLKGTGSRIRIRNTATYIMSFVPSRLCKEWGGIEAMGSSVEPDGLARTGQVSDRLGW